jgi:tetratricopeptide (TPR) repeat protein
VTAPDDPSTSAVEQTAGEGARPITARKIDPPKHLSESLLWKLQEFYYERHGTAAWSSGDVPFAMTNSPALARTYVQLITGLVEDCLAGRMGAFDPNQPIYVLDIGAGAGRLGYYCLEGLRAAELGRVKVVYVFVDRVEANLSFWSAHAKLRPFIDTGDADVANYDVAVGGPLHLVHAGTDLRPGEVANPLVAVANYLFDVIPQDLFCNTPNGLEEELVEMYSDEEEYSDSAELYDHIYLAARHAPVPPDRYPERATKVLEAAAAERPRDNARFLFPVASIATVDRLLELASDRLVLLIAEREETNLLPGTTAAPGGAARPAADGPTPRPGVPPASWGEPSHAYHPAVFFGLGSHGGSFSLPVDLDIMSIAARQSGGDLLRGHSTARRLAVSAMVVGDGGAASSIRARFENSVLALAPDDLCTVGMASLAAIASSRQRDEAALEVILAALRLTGYDAIPFAACFKDIAASLPPPPALRHETLRVLEKVYELNYWIEPEGDTAFAVATLVGRCGEYEQALKLLNEAREMFGARPLGHFNAAMCLLGMDRVPEALQELDACLELEPSHEGARQLRDRIRSGNVSPPTAAD